MRHSNLRKTAYYALIIASLSISSVGCGESSTPASSLKSDSTVEAAVSKSSPQSSKESSTSAKGSRDNTPHFLNPEKGSDVIDNDKGTVHIDKSNSSEGYIMIGYEGTNPKVKMQLTGPNGVTYTYTLHNGYDTFPLTSGSGSYNIKVFENIEGDQYSTAYSGDINATITNEFGPYLYPNQYVNYEESKKVSSLSEELAYSCNEDLDVVSEVYNYMISNYSYDYDKINNVQSGYVPDIDEIIQVKTGICFDYSAVMASLLRIQGIPTRLEVGYKKDVYHAWLSIYTEETGWINGIIEFHGTEWELMDPTFAATSSKPSKFTTENDEYTTKFVY